MLDFLPASIAETFDFLEQLADAERFDVVYDPVLGYPLEGRLDDQLLS